MYLQVTQDASFKFAQRFASLVSKIYKNFQKPRIITRIVQKLYNNMKI